MMVSALNFAFFYLCAFPPLRLSIFELSSFRAFGSPISREKIRYLAREKKREKFFSSRITYICQTKDEGMNELSN
jgi:hypothetical protein